MSKEKGSGLSRRTFLGTTAAATAGFTIIPSHVVSGLGHIAPRDKLNIAGVGVGGMGRRNLRNIERQNIVALCDVDWKYSQKTFNDFPEAKKYWDWRKMYDEMGKEISGVGMDTSIIGRIRIAGQPEPDRPSVKQIVVTDMTAAGHGNAVGMGLADVITERFRGKIDFESLVPIDLCTGRR